MDFVLVTFIYGDIAEDLKIPAFIPVGELIDVFHEIYGASGVTGGTTGGTVGTVTGGAVGGTTGGTAGGATSGATLHAEPKGMILDRSKTLKEQGVEHGALLTLSPAPVASPAPTLR